jgi:hypothetical protein
VGVKAKYQPKSIKLHHQCLRFLMRPFVLFPAESDDIYSTYVVEDRLYNKKKRKEKATFFIPEMVKEKYVNTSDRKKTTFLIGIRIDILRFYLMLIYCMCVSQSFRQSKMAPLLIERLE